MVADRQFVVCIAVVVGTGTHAFFDSSSHCLRAVTLVAPIGKFMRTNGAALFAGVVV